jgi:hypothetical protein
MKSSSSLSVSFDAKRANLPVTIAIVIGTSVVLGLLLTGTAEEMIAYLVVAIACAVPCALWVWAGSNSIPIMPAVSIMYFIYYGIPILRGNVSGIGWAVYRGNVGGASFDGGEILGAAATVALFVVAATISWGVLLMGIARRPKSTHREIVSGVQLQRFMVVGLAFGILYHVALFSGLLAWLGPNFGFVRAIMLTAATVGCFLLGHARARGLVRGKKWALALVSMGALVSLAWATLFLVGGMIFCLATVSGYVITSKRVPWTWLSAAIVVVLVLHAGKDHMRYKYWLKDRNYSSEVSVMQIPSLMSEWAETGVSTIVNGDYYDSVVDRASLLNLLLRAQRLAPDYVPYLEGRTYAVLPYMLIPRFISPDKISSQRAMNMLNIHFGFQSAREADKTAIGWGLVAEAYANFGRVGVLGIAVLFGLFVGFFERWSDNAPLASLPSLVAAAVMMQLINVEGDAAGLLTTLFQSIVAIACLFWFFGLVSKQKDITATIAADGGRRT